MRADTEKTMVIIVGAGLSGICQGIALKRAGINFIILEKANEPGGTWNKNRYPGCGCDIPMFAYSYSFEPFWGDAWPKQPEILNYLKNCVSTYNIGSHIRYECTVTSASYIDNENCWSVVVNANHTLKAKYLINATGQLDRAYKPHIPSEEIFKGIIAHSANIQGDIDYTGMNVAVIGMGATALQITEALQPKVNQLNIFARSSKYIFPRSVYSDLSIKRMLNDKEYWLTARSQFLEDQERFRNDFLNTKTNNLIDFKHTVKSLHGKISDSVEKFYSWQVDNNFFPDYPAGCSRPLVSDYFHEVIQADNVRLIREFPLHFNAHSISTQSGDFAADAIIYATGFQLNNLIPPYEIIGLNGIKLSDKWKNYPSAYLGISVDEFPNYFMLYGPNTNTYASSVTFFVEAQSKYILETIEFAENNRYDCIHVKKVVVDQYVSKLKGLARSLPDMAQCSSWYKNDHNENISIFPGGFKDYENLLSNFSSNDYQFFRSKTIKDNVFNEQEVALSLIEFFSETTLIEAEKISATANFSEFALDSILITDFIKRINKKWNLSVPVSCFFDVSCIKDLAKVILPGITIDDSVDVDLSKKLVVAPKLSERAVAHWRSIKPKSSCSFQESPINHLSGVRDDVAVIAIHGYFPQSDNIEEYWENLCAERNCVTEIPQDRWIWQEYYGDPSAGDRTKVKWGGFINNVDMFDPLFFGISPKDAEFMDPQHRLFIQCTWELLELAGYAPDSLPGKNIGVLVGINLNDYADIGADVQDEVDVSQMTGLMHLFAPNRISYILGLNGPSEVIDTACSSSLVAIHRAIQSIQVDHCEMMIVGGSNLILQPKMHLLYSKAGMLSEQGQCFTFSDLANGYVRGEGVAAVLLKKCTLAERDGDNILALIKGSATNHGGGSNSLTAPNSEAQVSLIQTAVKNAGIDPRTIGYIECHGTGTPLGDPVEVRAIQKAYEKLTDKIISDDVTPRSCALGSVKSNIGHLEAAAGVAGFIKTVLCLHNRFIPANIHSQPLNREISLKHGEFYIPSVGSSWEPIIINGVVQPLRAGVSSFGAGGSNAHIILEEYSQTVAPRRADVTDKLYILPLSANTPESLLTYATRLHDFMLRKGKSLAIDDVAFTLQVGRSALRYRVALISRDIDEAMLTLARYISGEAEPDGLIFPSRVKPSNHEPYNKLNTEDRVRKLIHDSNYHDLAQSWTNGNVISWFDIYEKNFYKPKRVVLPTHPFTLSRYWVTKPNQFLKKNKHDIFKAKLTVSNLERKECEVDSIDHEMLNDQQNIMIKLERDIKTILTKHLKISPDLLHRDDNFSSFGLDSIGMGGFSRAIEMLLGIPISPSLFYSHYTIGLLVSYFEKTHAQQLNSHYGVDRLSHRDFKNETTPVKKIASKANTITATNSDTLNAKDIAIIGISGRFPGARNIEEFWGILLNGENAVTEIPADRFNIAEYFGDPTVDNGKTNGKWCGLLPGVAEFDALFFEISPKEAASMDPRQRLLMQEAWLALEDAGFGESELIQNTIGLFVAIEEGDYSLLEGGGRFKGNITSNHDGVLAARLGYFLDLKGPIIALNTACSSGLVATHQAILNLQQEECDTAIVAGINILCSPETYVALGQAGMLSSDGKCFAFDQRANGLVPGEAVAVLVLKPLHKAVRDGDRIQAVIKGSGVNYDGRTNGIAAPNGLSQCALIQDVYQRYSIDPEQITYMIAHGTGTRLGDPIEVNAVGQAFKAFSEKRGYCALTSNKSNVGHTFAASGVVSIINLVLAIQHKVIPATLNVETESTYIDWQQSPFYVNKFSSQWDIKNNQLRMGAVSAFGMSGTNAHIVVSEYQAEPKIAHHLLYYLLPVSGRCEHTLREKVKDLLGLLCRDGGDETSLSALAYTLQSGRHHFSNRAVIIVRSIREAINTWQEFLDGQYVANLFSGVTGEFFSEHAGINQFLTELIRNSKNQTGNPSTYFSSLAVIADFYCRGYSINWALIYSDNLPNKIAIPGYPFIRDKYWLGEINPNQTVDLSKGALKRDANEDNYSIYLLQENEEVVSFVDERRRLNYKHHDIFFVEAPYTHDELHPLFPEGNLYLYGQDQQQSVDELFMGFCHEIFDFLKKQLEKALRQPHLLQVVLSDNNHGKLYRSISGLLKTVTIENSYFITQVITYSDSCSLNDIGDAVRKCRDLPERRTLFYANGKVISRGMKPLHLSTNDSLFAARNMPWKNGGTYILSGGLGGIGKIFCQEILRHTKNANVVLLGRSSLQKDKEAAVAALSSVNGNVIYECIDICDKAAISELFSNIEHRYGNIKGILHIAGVLDNGYLWGKEKKRFDSVLSPKVAGTVSLDEASQNLNLDFFVLFSSTIGLIGNEGQGDYACANAFLDEYAGYRNQLAIQGKRKGKSLAIDWSLWRNGGMPMDENLEKRLIEKFGMVAMSNEDGMNAFYQGLHSNFSQIGILFGQGKKVFAPFNSRKVALSQSVETFSGDAQSGKNIAANCTQQLKKLIGEYLSIPAEKLNEHAPFECYGINSMMITRLNFQLEEIFLGIPKTVFFENRCIAELAAYIVEEYPLACEGWGNPSTITIEKKSDREKGKIDIPDRANLDAMALGNGHNKIAIIGVSGRFPGAETLDEYWELLVSGKSCITEIPSDRWSIEGFYEKDKDSAISSSKSYSKWGGFIEDAYAFDPLLFGINPRDALAMDPQERIFLQCCWSLFENAGYTRERIAHQHHGRVGVFAGVTKPGYNLYRLSLAEEDNRIYPGTSFSSVANRVSFVMNLNGPSMPVDTMCSSSLSAVHLACESLYLNNCEMAVAGGVNLYLHPSSYIDLSAQRMLSSDGYCRSFGEGGDGFVPGEGVGALLLKPLNHAIRDGDRIEAIIHGSNMNHGGKMHGYTVPNPKAQSKLIQDAIGKSALSARQISYVEAHGTGTELGDPVEVRGLTQAFRTYTKDKAFCAVGSVKSNIGHLESAAGIAGLLKVILQLKNKQLVPTLHCQTTNPNIDFAESPFFINSKIQPWLPPDVDGVTNDRIAGVSSFGAGGVNAHIIIGEAPAVTNNLRPTLLMAGDNTVVLPISAQTDCQLFLYVKLIAAYLEKLDHATDPNFLENLAYTFQIGRESMPVRIGVIADSIENLQGILQCYLSGSHNVKGLIFQDASSITHPQEASNSALSRKLILWTKGESVSWNTNDANPQLAGKIIDAPTYPFERSVYKLKQKNDRIDDIKKIENERSVFLKKSWKKIDEITFNSRLKATNVCILSESNSNIANALVDQYFTQAIIIDNPQNFDCFFPEDYFPSICIDLLGLSDQGKVSCEWLVCIQSLVERTQQEACFFLGVSQGLECHDGDSSSLNGACRASLYRMLGAEYRNAPSRHLDLAIDFSIEKSAEIIACECSEFSGSVEVSYKNKDRYGAYISEIEKPLGEQANLKFPRNKVLWITGGTRGVGFACAEYFVKQLGVKKLVLTGRELLPPRADWEKVSAGKSSCALKIRNLLTLEAQGVEVRVLSDNLESEAVSKEYVTDVVSSMGAIGGILHCAGVMDLDNRAFIRKSCSSVADVYLPKIDGLFRMLSVMEGQPLAFVALFSSVSAVIPKLANGQSDYAMANAYMDYLATSNRFAFPVYSIQWPSWKDVGMGEVKTAFYQDTGFLSHDTPWGLRCLDAILSGLYGRVVMPARVRAHGFNCAVLLERIWNNTGKYISDKDESEKSERQSSAVSAGIPELTLEWLLNLFHNELRLPKEKIDKNKPFIEYGIDSILVAHTTRLIQKQLSVSIDPSILYECESLAELSQWLVKQFSKELSSLFDGTTQLSNGENSLKSAQSKERDSNKLKNYNKKIDSNDIAIVGMSCRFPEAATLDSYWDLLANGSSAITKVDKKRFDLSEEYYGAMLTNVDHFDANFFRIPVEDAEVMDPQGLIILEQALKAIYHAGYNSTEFKGRDCGVYIGARSSFNGEIAILDRSKNPITAVGQNYLAANISHFFDLHGPSLVVDTACSSALVAMNYAVNDLLQGNIDSALVGGVNVLRDTRAYQLFKRRNLLAETGDFHVFDGRASGIVLGEGAGIVMLKKLSDAVRDNDHIYAVIKAIAMNNDGRTTGPAAPNINAQKAVMQSALKKCTKKPEEIFYIEANASGTEVTDLLELKAVQDVYRKDSHDPCYLGSIKPNIGHPLCAEGIAGLIKLALMLDRRKCVPFLSGEVKMNHFDINASPFCFARELFSIPVDNNSVALNCFADGGTNIHIVLDPWDMQFSSGPIRIPQSIPQLNPQKLTKPESKLTLINSTELEPAMIENTGNNLRVHKHNRWKN